jgi:hypothetical protein
MVIIAAAVISAAVIAFWLGRVLSAPISEDAPFQDLWLYQQALSDCGHGIGALIEEASTPSVSDAHVALVRARAAAYPRADYLRPEARHLLSRPSLPDLNQPGMDLVDTAHAYLALAEHLADEIVRSQFGDRWHPSMTKPMMPALTDQTADRKSA